MKSLIGAVLLIDPGFAQLKRMRLSLGDRPKGQLGMLQFLDLSHFVICVENQSTAMPLFSGAKDSDAINGMVFVL